MDISCLHIILLSHDNFGVFGYYLYACVLPLILVYCTPHTGVVGECSTQSEDLSANDHGYSELRDRLMAAVASQEVVTTTLHPNKTLSSLQKVKDYQITDRAAKFHCRVKLVRVLTPSIEETVRLSCDRCGLFEPIPRSTKTELESGLCTEPCPGCLKAGQHPSHVPYCWFCIQLLVVDHTASLEVHVYDDVAIPLFGGLKSTNFYQHPSARDQLESKLCQLSGGNPPFSQETGDHLRPWVDCCLIKVRDEKLPGVLYCLFDTALK